LSAVKRQELLDSEQRYSELFDFSPQPMWVFDLETLDFMDVNLAAIKHYGYNRSEFLSMKISDIRPSEEIPALMEEVQETRSVNPYFAVGVFKHLKKMEKSF
jgi:PAS domain S-box-containing protein